MGMKKELAEQFSEEVERYRRSLLYHARISDWEAFKVKAGKLFDYLETIEYSELERRFFSTFARILAVLGLTVISLLSLNFRISPILQDIKQVIIVAALAGSGFALYFFLNYRSYLSVKTYFYQKRREHFIREMEKDFQNYTVEVDKAA